jgi:hypothetical protein
VSVAACPARSRTVSWKTSTAPTTSGAVNVATALVAPDSVTAGPESWAHSHEARPSSGSKDADPSRVTRAPLSGVWSGPATAVGGMLRGWKVSGESLRSSPRLPEGSYASTRKTTLVAGAAISGTTKA